MTGDARTESSTAGDEMDEFDLRELAALASRVGIYPVSRSTRMLVIIEIRDGEYHFDLLPWEVPQ